jgi:hypothetical protein
MFTTAAYHFLLIFLYLFYDFYGPEALNEYAHWQIYF